MMHHRGCVARAKGPHHVGEGRGCTTLEEHDDRVPPPTRSIIVPGDAACDACDALVVVAGVPLAEAEAAAAAAASARSSSSTRPAIPARPTNPRQPSAARDDSDPAELGGGGAADGGAELCCCGAGVGVRAAGDAVNVRKAALSGVPGDAVRGVWAEESGDRCSMGFRGGVGSGTLGTRRGSGGGGGGVARAANLAASVSTSSDGRSASASITKSSSSYMLLC
jgi:hypothetical protein